MQLFRDKGGPAAARRLPKDFGVSTRQFVLLVCCAAAVGCRGWSGGRVELSRRQLDGLLAEAAAPADLGLVSRESASGGYQLRGLYRMPAGGTECVGMELGPDGGDVVPRMWVQSGPSRTLAVVDTGASVSLATYGWARSGGVRAVGPEAVRFPSVTFRGSRDALVGVLPELTVGDLRIEKVPVGIVDHLPGMGSRCEQGAGVGLLLGQDFLRRFGQVRFDLRTRTLCWIGPEADPPAEPAARAVGRWLRVRSGLPQFAGRIGEGPPAPVVWDSGGDFGLWIPRDLARDLGLPRAGSPVAHWAARLFRLSSDRPLAAQGIRIGELSIPSLTTYVGRIQGGEADPGFVLMGSEVLRRHAVVLDYRRREIRFF